MSPEMNAKIQLWRQKAREGTLTQDEMKEAIAALRQDRIGASGRNEATRERKATTRAKKNISSEDLLNELDGLVVVPRRGPGHRFPEKPASNRPLKKWASNASGTLFSKKRVAQTRLRSDCTGQSGLFAGHLAHFGRTYPRAHA